MPPWHADVAMEPFVGFLGDQKIMRQWRIELVTSWFQYRTQDHYNIVL
jgi:hypothetical protein